MNRRSFFKSASLLLGAASLSPTIFIPKFEPVKWKQTSAGVRRLIYINPEYRMAQFEVVLIGDAEKAVIVSRRIPVWASQPFGNSIRQASYPPRFNQLEDGSGTMVQVHPFVISKDCIVNGKFEHRPWLKEIPLSAKAEGKLTARQLYLSPIGTTHVAI